MNKYKIQIKQKDTKTMKFVWLDVDRIDHNAHKTETVLYCSKYTIDGTKIIVPMILNDKLCIRIRGCINENSVKLQ